MTVRLSNDTLPTYLQMQLPKFKKKVGKFTGFSGHFSKNIGLFLISFKAYRILLFSNSIQIQPPKSLYGIIYQIFVKFSWRRDMKMI